MNDDLYKQFCEIRDFMLSNLQIKLNTFFCDAFDAFNSHILCTETVKIIKQEAVNEYPEYPIQYFPKCKIKCNVEERSLEIGIQEYFDPDLSLIFLANVEIEGIKYDLYCRLSSHPSFQYDFIARHGHAPNMKVEGSKTAAAEYMLGWSTPLSIAFAFAIEEGFVS
jgi:hypothetical protein